MRVPMLLLLIAVLAMPSFARPTGRLVLKTAILNYEPYINGVPYWQACGWPDPLSNATPVLTEGISKASDNMVLMRLVHTTNVNLFPHTGAINGFGTHRITAEQYWQVRTNNFRGAVDAKLGNAGYLAALTGDFPHILGMIERGEVDHVMIGGGPYFGYWETLMVGTGAWQCNSVPLSWTNERIVVANCFGTPGTGNGLHNYGHGLGFGMESWFFNPGAYRETWHDKDYLAAINDFALFCTCARFTNEIEQRIMCGHTHYPPNAPQDYDYNNTNRVWSHTDQWYSYPVMTNPPRFMNNYDWSWGRTLNGKIDANDTTFQLWWWNHIPRYLGFTRGHLNNWLTYAWNPWKASYPLGAGVHTQRATDLRGWFSYELYCPPGTTQMTVSVQCGRPVYFGIRKNLVPYAYRCSAEGRSGDDWTTVRDNNHTWILTPSNSFGKGLEGYWYISFGASGDAPRWRNTADYRIETSILPRPQGAATAVQVTHPQANAVYRAAQVSNAIAWTVADLPQGARAVYLAYEQPARTGAWQPIAEDYHYQMQSPYDWFLPTNVVGQTRVRVIVEDVYGVCHTNYSAAFSLSRDQ